MFTGRVLAVHDDGTGPALWSASSQGSQNLRWIVKFDGERTAMIARAQGGFPTPASAGGVLAMTSHDDGSGPALYVAGDFTAIEGTPAVGFARLRAGRWESVGGAPDGRVLGLMPYDEGERTVLLAVGEFAHIGNVTARGIARWDGIAWTEFAGGLIGREAIPAAGVVMTMHDDGSGPALHVGGRFVRAGEVPANNVAKWDGVRWSSLDLGVYYICCSARVASMASFDDPEEGPSLFVYGGFSHAGSDLSDGFARWDGQAWHDLSPDFRQAFMTMRSATINGEATFFLGARMRNAPVSESLGLFRRRSGVWERLLIIPTMSQHNLETISDMASFDDGSGESLYVAGNFGTIIPRKHGSRNMFRWDGQAAHPLPTFGIDGGSVLFSTMRSGSTTRLFAGGDFNQLAGRDIHTLAEFDGEQWRQFTTEGLDPLANPRRLIEFDDGGGTSLFLAGTRLIDLGHYGYAGLVPLRNGRWESLPHYALGSVGTDQPFVFDDGFGPRLYSRLRGWNGVNWLWPGGLPPAPDVYSMDVSVLFDDGSGPAIYVAGRYSDGLRMRSFARFINGQWEWIDTPGTEHVRQIWVAGPPGEETMYVQTTESIWNDKRRFFRYEHGVWTLLSNIEAGAQIRTVHWFDSGDGGSLYVFGDFTRFEGLDADGAVRLHRGQWKPFGHGFQAARVSSVATFVHNGRPAMWLSGSYFAANQRLSGQMAVFEGCHTCYADCDATTGRGVLDIFDFLCFGSRFAMSDPYACDCDQSTGPGVCDVFDFLCFHSAFARGCW